MRAHISEWTHILPHTNTPHPAHPTHIPHPSTHTHCVTHTHTHTPMVIIIDTPVGVRLGDRHAGGKKMGGRNPASTYQSMYGTHSDVRTAQSLTHLEAEASVAEGIVTDCYRGVNL
jgi:hypothetical protein